jgi:glycosyltransferase involved in cell wall biosynthesis
MPNSVLEAMSYSKPVLGTTVGGLLEIVTSGENGLLVKPDSPSSLAEGLEKMLRVDQAAYAQNAKKVAFEHSWDNITKCYLDLYQSLLRL